VDKAKEVGQNILNNMVGQNVLGFTFRKTNQAVTLDSRSTVQINDDLVQIDPQLLFQRLILTGTQTGELAEIFEHELCSYPPVLFEEKGIILAPNKPVLAKAILEESPQNERGPAEDHSYVIDGGALLHRIPWQVGETYNETIAHYTDYVIKKYGRATVVFDGYSDGPSTKDATHQRRNKGKSGRKVTFRGDMKVSIKKEEFLTNAENKERFIHLLGDGLERVQCMVSYASGDADLLIVKTTVALSVERDAVLVGEDTDLLVLLCYYTTKGVQNDTFFLSEPKSTSLQPRRFMNISALRDKLGDIVCNNILFVHAILGCDTTSRVHGVGKAASLNLMKESPYFALQATVFSDQKSEPGEIARAGENAMVVIYKGKTTDTLDKLRHQKFLEKVTVGKTLLHPRVLPPTSAAAKFHSFRVFHQIQEWKGHKLDPERWGWKILDGKMVPIQSDAEVAPKCLLDLVRCTCKAGCNDKRCGCRKQGLSCTLACGSCRGVCANVDELDSVDTDSEEM